MLMALLQGLLVGGSICLSLGPQSIFVLREGIHGSAPLAVATVCTLADFVLIGVGTAGANLLLGDVAGLAETCALGTTGLLGIYGSLLLVSALRPAVRKSTMDRGDLGRARALGGAAALSLLNPQTYLEMLLLVGAVTLTLPAHDRVGFAVGVALVSPVWFFGLVLGARCLSRWLARPGVLRALDAGTGLAMLVAAASIGAGQLSP